MEAVLKPNELKDETAYLLQDEANKNHLLEGIEAVKQGRISRTFTIEEIEAMAK